MAFEETVRSRKKQLRTTQEELAEAVFVTPQAVSEWKNSKIVPGPFKQSAIANALKLGKAALLRVTFYSALA